MITFIRTFILLVAITLASCADGRQASSLVTSHGTSSNPAQSKTTASIIVMLSSVQRSSTSQSRRTPAYVNPESSLIAITVDGIETDFNVSSANTAPYGTANFTPTPSQPCIYIADGSLNNTFRTCTLTVGIPDSSPQIVATAFGVESGTINGTPVSYNVALSSGATNPTITVGAVNQFSIALNPILAAQQCLGPFQSSCQTPFQYMTVSTTQGSMVSSGGDCNVSASDLCQTIAIDIARPVTIGTIGFQAYDALGVIPSTKPASPATTPETFVPNNDSFIGATGISNPQYQQDSLRLSSPFTHGGTSGLFATPIASCASNPDQANAITDWSYTSAYALSQEAAVNLCYDGSYSSTSSSFPVQGYEMYFTDNQSGGFDNTDSNRQRIWITPMYSFISGSAIVVAEKFQSGNQVTATLGALSADGGGASPDGTCAPEVALSVSSTVAGPGQSISAIADMNGKASFTFAPPATGHACTINYQFASQALVVTRAYTATNGSIVVTFGKHRALGGSVR